MAFPFALMGVFASTASTAHAQSDDKATDSKGSPAPPPSSSPPPRGSLLPNPQDDAAPSTPSPPAAGSVDPAADQRELEAQGRQRPVADGLVGSRSQDVYSEDWFSRIRPVLELHGYFRTRGELFHNFALGRHDGANNALWPQPIDNSFVPVGGNANAVSLGLCGSNPNVAESCQDKTQATANMRFRINPELHISDNLRIMAQIDMLDNLVLGSTPDAYAMQPGSGSNGYVRSGGNPYAPIALFSNTQGPPTAGVNGWRNSIDVKRAWGEYMTPVGQIRFGRMPHHWGLGMMWNSGDNIDADYHSTIDRIMFTSGIKALDLYFGGSWDFVSSGPTNANAYSVYGGQPYNTGNLTNVNQWSLFVARRTNPELQRLQLSRNQVVINGGLYAVYRSQYLDLAGNNGVTETPWTFGSGANSGTNNGLERRNAQIFIPDAWVQILFKKFRFEAEFASVWGNIERAPNAAGNNASDTKVRQYGLTTQTEFKAIEDKLRLNLGFGWASGDPWQDSLQPQTGPNAFNSGNGPVSTFRMNPAYNVDLIFFRRILSRVEGAYYFRPSVEYDFLRSPGGQKFGGNAAVIWSRASEFVQSPGHNRDLGLELNLSLYYQAKDGALNDDPDKLGGFFAMLQYGVFFPLGGLNYLPNITSANTPGISDWSTSSAHTIRLFMGIVY
ncbi:TIGR04551 family protein [Pendulispora rubella]|uniref:TIGR04551 family protein n=2 Tax=Pendulispora rubella TaxID=2741070 RepID=A0ABZ2LBR5_9BACT